MIDEQLSLSRATSNERVLCSRMTSQCLRVFDCLFSIYSTVACLFEWIHLECTINLSHFTRREGNQQKMYRPIILNKKAVGLSQNAILEFVS